MLANIISGALLGIDAYRVSVEVDMAMGLPQLTIVGLPDGAVRESKERVRTAIKNSGYSLPSRRVTINLAPADIRKEGSAFDLPIALGMLACAGGLATDSLGEYMILGELALDGKLRPIKGALSLAAACRDMGKKGVILPMENALEAAVVEGVDVIGIEALDEAIHFLNGNLPIDPCCAKKNTFEVQPGDFNVDFCDVKGQEHVKRALEVAAAGGHNVVMVGPPGSGKTMLSRRLATILPAMIFEESLETTKVYSVMGLVSEKESLIASRPFRSPHHTISDVGLIGGGKTPKPGEISLAHNGVLFLDELPEFKRNVLEVMRQPMEDNRVTITRSMVSVTYPARFMLVAAMNPCPCGYLGDPRHECSCSPAEIVRYRTRISGPLLDRIDIHVEVPAVRYKELSDKSRGEDSKCIRERVETARKIQLGRYTNGDAVAFCNAQMAPRQLRKFCQVDSEGERLLEMVVDKLGMSARAYDRILKVARTIADLDDCAEIKPVHLSEAIQYRALDRPVA